MKKLFLNKFNKTLGTTVLLMLISACATLKLPSADVPEIKRYEIALPESWQTNLPKDAPPVLVYPIQSSSIYDTPRIAYQIKPFEIAYYVKNEWANSPRHMLFPIVIAILEDGGQFSAVVNTSSGVFARWALETELLELLHRYDDDSSEVSLRMRLQLVDLDNKTVVATKTLQFVQPVASNDPLGAVIATNKIIPKLKKEMQQFLRPITTP